MMEGDSCGRHRASAQAAARVSALTGAVCAWWPGRWYMADSMCRTRASNGVGCLQLDSQPQLVGANAGGLSQPLDDDGDALAECLSTRKGRGRSHLRVRWG